MKAMHRAAASCLALTLALAVPAFAGEQQTQGSESRPDTQRSAKSESGMEQAKSGSPQGEKAWTAQKRAEDISGTEVVNSAGETIGEVESVVRKQGTDKIDAVVSVGGFLGIGDKEVVIPLSELRMERDQLVAPIASTEEELKARPNYEKGLYKQVPDKEMVKIGAAGSETSGTGMRKGAVDSFAELDTDGNGFLSKDEATDAANLSEQWQQADTDGDEQIDRAEFAAFETSAPMKTREQQGMPGETKSGSMGAPAREQPGAGSMPSQKGGGQSDY